MVKNVLEITYEVDGKDKKLIFFYVSLCVRPCAVRCLCTEY